MGAAIVIGVSVSVLWAAAAAPAAPAAQDGGDAAQLDATEEVQALQREGRLAEALSRATRVPDAAEAARLEAEIRWAAGDLDGALAVAEEGLRAAPLDLGLASIATDVALTLDLAEPAAQHLASLDRALAAAPPDAPAAAWWTERRDGLASGVQDASARLAARDSALRRARAVAVAAALAGGCAAAFLWRRGAGRP